MAILAAAISSGSKYKERGRIVESIATWNICSVNLE